MGYASIENEVSTDSDTVIQKRFHALDKEAWWDRQHWIRRAAREVVRRMRLRG